MVRVVDCRTESQAKLDLVSTRMGDPFLQFRTDIVQCLSITFQWEKNIKTIAQMNECF